MGETLPAALPASHAALDETRAFLEHIFPSPRTFAIRLWTGEVMPAADVPRFTLTLASPSSLRRMFRTPIELSMGEAYLRGDFDVEGDLSAAFDLVPATRAAIGGVGDAAGLLLRWFRLPAAQQRGGRIDIHPPVELHGRKGSHDRDQTAIRYHYDVGNDFYELFLDERMIYSCAYFPTGSEDLDAAQVAKLDLICRKLRLQPGERLLDVGCGWGGMLIHAARNYGVSGVGVTLSRAQFELASERVRAAGLSDRIDLQLRDYRDLPLDEPFDKVVSVGMFEHVGRVGMHEYFTRIHQLLAPGGLFLNHAISDHPRDTSRGLSHRVSRALDSLLVGNFTFRTRYVFPDGELMPVSEANLEAERAGFEVRDVENLREHYALTIRHWLQRLRANREEALAIAGGPMYRLWELYLAGCIQHFDTGKIGINQSLMARPVAGVSGLPWSRSDLYHG